MIRIARIPHVIDRMVSMRENILHGDFPVHDRTIDVDFATLKIPKKDDATAKDFRNKAKEFLAKEEYEAAAYLFTAALAYAETSKSRALSYACRPSALMKMKRYQDAILDIDRALKAGCREDLKPKLLSGRKLCEEREELLSIEGPPSIPVCEQHPSIQCAKNCIDITESEEFGKHIVTNRDIEIGEIIAIDKPFCLTVMAYIYEYCSECGKNSYDLIPCDSCVTAVYCNDTCKKKAEEYHKYECLVQHVFTDETLSSCTVVLKTTLLSFCRNNDVESEHQYRSDRYREVYELSTHLDKFDGDRLYEAIFTASLMFLALKNYTTFFQDFDHLNDLEQLFKKRAVHSFAASNIHAVNLFFPPQLVAGIYSLYGLFNHSCCPNVNWTTHDNSMILRANRTIKEGEQCFVSYRETSYWTSDRAELLSRLKERYYFTCGCRVCSENWPVPSLTSNKDYEDAIKELKKADVDFAKQLLPKLYAEVKRLEKLEPCPELIFVDDLVKKCHLVLAGRGYVTSSLNDKFGV